MTHRLGRVLLLVASLCWLGFSSPARAQSEEQVRDEARALAKDGIAALDEGRAEEALDKLRQAEAKFHAPTHLLFIARAHTALKQYAEAYEVYVDILVEDVPNYASEAFHKAQKSAGDEIAAVRAKLPTLRIEVQGAAAGRAAVTIDGTEVPAKRLQQPVAVTAGAHTVVASAPGMAAASQDVEARVGETTPVSLTLVAASAREPTGSAPAGSAAAADSSSSLPIAAGVAFGIGGAALVVGGITGGMTLSRADDIKSTCTDNSCPPEQESEADDAKVLGNVSTAMFIVGGVGVAAGIVLLIADATGGSESTGRSAGPSLSARITPTGVALTGRF